MKLLWNRKFVFFLIPYLVLYFISSHNALFWDTIQFAGDHPNWYYDNHFSNFLLPDSCDSGHPPAFGLYLALVWTLFGKSLWISHTAMLPFIILLVAQAVRTGDLLFPHHKKYSFLCTLLLLSESVLLTQCTLVSPDIWVIAFFLLTLNAIMSRSVWQLILAVILMSITSNRAMMCAVTLYLFALSYNYDRAGITIKSKIDYIIKQVLPFMPGALLAIAYFIYHYYVKGWVGYPKYSTWAAGFEIVPAPRILKNVFILGWRIIDLGKIGTALVFVWMIILWWRKKLSFSSDERSIARSLFILFLSLFFITALPLTLYQGLLTHRYFLPLTICMTLIVVFFLFHSSIKNKVWIVAFMVLIQLSGHFWNYPRRVSQGWEGTLGHLYFYPMREEFKAYMLQHGIEKEDVATSSTLMQADSRVDLTSDTTSYKDFEQDTTTYIWYCNVSNAMNKSVDYYFRHFEIVKQAKRGHVEMVLFRRPALKK